MTCDHVEDRLSRYRDGELDRLGEWRIRYHLRRCPRCTAAADDAAELDFAMRLAVVEPEPPHYLTSAVMRRLPAMPPARAGAGLPFRGRGIRWVVGVGCAAAQIAGLWGAYCYGYTRAEQRRPALLSTFGADRLWAARPPAPAAEPGLRRRSAWAAPQPVR